ncbi:MAG: NeuD/PglB/VioB family sugar acetyltransferase [Leptospirales bacterium]|nr:NeuD/PglB/VioB family sugar acetyltransferase [Leptospirales bacterium]
MTAPKILLVGAGGHARSVIDVVETAGEYDIVGLVGTPEQVGQQLLGRPILGHDGDLQKLRAVADYAIVAIGQIKTAESRTRAWQSVRDAGFITPKIVAPTARVARSAAIGDGTVIFHFAFVNSCASVGANCIINSCALLEHDVIVEDHCHISTGVILNGGVRVHERSFVGSGAIVRENTTIGNNSIVPMGHRVIRSWPSSAELRQ